MIITNNPTTHILAHLEIGFRTDSTELDELGQDLTATLQRVRHFGAEHGSLDFWKTNWQQQWNNVERILSRIRGLVNEMDGWIESSASDHLKSALKVWETFEAEDAQLVEALSAIRAQTSGLKLAVRKDWNLLARTLESHLETIHACGQALRVKLELLKEHSKEIVDHVVRNILAKYLNRTHAAGTEAENHDQEYRQAAAELELERHKYLGFVDVVKGLFMWIETTEERARKNLSLEVEQAGKCTFAN